MGPERFRQVVRQGDADAGPDDAGPGPCHFRSSSSVQQLVGLMLFLVMILFGV